MKIKIFIAMLILGIGSLFGENKTALLIANGEYQYFSSLRNPIPEALQLQEALERLGFQVMLLQNASREEMLEGVLDFEDLVRQRGGLAFFHYGGHAVQVNGENFLIPSNADIQDSRRVVTRAVNVAEIMASLETAEAQSSIVILDACRNNPLPENGPSSATRGLAISQDRPDNSIVVYSAESGTVARDGVFTPLLIELLETPGLSFTDILMETRQRVYQMTQGEQIPGQYSQLFHPIYFADSTPEGNRERESLLNQMVLVQAGAFEMGSARNEAGRDNDETLHRVTLTQDFYISPYEVTQELWEEVMGSNPSHGDYGIGPNYPVNKVSWFDAVEFCNALSRLHGLTPAYAGTGRDISCDFSASGYRLPTEAEWEYAARGGQFQVQQTRYAGSDSIISVAWYSDNAQGQNNPVGQLSPNLLGLYDMSGNVYEWCWDWFSAYGGESQDPKGGSNGPGRVIRGGSWRNFADRCRVAFRNSGEPQIRNYNFGFRIVRTVE